MGSLEASAQDRAKWKQFVGGLCSTSGATKASTYFRHTTL